LENYLKIKYNYIICVHKKKVKTNRIPNKHGTLKMVVIQKVAGGGLNIEFDVLVVLNQSGNCIVIIKKQSKMNTIENVNIERKII